MILMVLSNLILHAQVDSASVNARIEESFFNQKTGYYREELPKNDKAFNWTLGILISAKNSLARLDKANVQKLLETLEKGDTYWNPKGPVAGFDVLPGPPYPDDRYYDDNAWMVMSLVESYEITGNQRWLKRAEEALSYVLSGEDEKLGGGIYWREKDKPGKNTCSNGPAAAACLAVYQHNHKKELLSKAEEIYNWTKKNFQDPSDLLYWDSINIKTEKLDKTKWTYNSALMLRSAKELFRLTKNEEFKKDADALEDACIKKWVKADGSISDEMQFAHLLFENLDPKIFDATLCIKKLRELSGSDGLFPTKWSAKDSKQNKKLIIQVSALRAFAVYELWVKEGKVKA
jgi:hypothetical protein